MNIVQVTAIFALVAVIAGHARIKYPRPLAASPDNPDGNYYNGPLSPDGSQFPCKGLHKQAGVDKTPTAVWEAGKQAHFEILGHMFKGEGNLAAHSGGSCQASISFDNGKTWKVLHSFIGGCPRGTKLGSNMAGADQKFPFKVPQETRAGVALFSWTWIAVTGNRNEMFQNCASVKITGNGASTLDDLPDMFVGDMSLPGHIGPGECRSTGRAALEYPIPGEAVTTFTNPSIPFRKPTRGKCFAAASDIQPANNSQTTATTQRTTKPITTRITTTKPLTTPEPSTKLATTAIPTTTTVTTPSVTPKVSTAQIKTAKPTTTRSPTSDSNTPEPTTKTVVTRPTKTQATKAPITAKPTTTRRTTTDSISRERTTKAVVTRPIKTQATKAPTTTKPTTTRATTTEGTTQAVTLKEVVTRPTKTQATKRTVATKSTTTRATAATVSTSRAIVKRSKIDVAESKPAA